MLMGRDLGIAAHQAHSRVRWAYDAKQEKSAHRGWAGPGPACKLMALHGKRGRIAAEAGKSLIKVFRHLQGSRQRCSGRRAARGPPGPGARVG